MAIAVATKSLADYRKACRLEVVEACNAAAAMVEAQKLPSLEAFEVYREACKGGALWACGEAALVAISKGLLSTKERRDLLAVGCENGVRKVCDLAAGLFSPVDALRAAALRKLAKPPPPPPIHPASPWLLRPEILTDATRPVVAVSGYGAVAAPAPKVPAPAAPPKVDHAAQCRDGERTSCVAVGDRPRACALGDAQSCEIACKALDFVSCARSSPAVREAYSARAAETSLPALLSRCDALRTKLAKTSMTEDPKRRKIVAIACAAAAELAEEAVDRATDVVPATFLPLSKKVGDRCTCE